ncbi:MAG: nucleoside hydrolase [Bifidobacteriaceae bacterium]|jgi:inosine-uridine nucleoside N-ribohydrolase|nr:nucleoside hydrolase [Bifidobacteriaceae bacterium]
MTWPAPTTTKAALWEPKDPAWLTARLQPPPAGQVIDMVLDTDTYNEVDDQFALAYALLSPERLNVQAIYAAPFLNDRSTDPGDGMDKSQAEIRRLLRLLGRPTDGFVYEGSRTFLPGPTKPVDSPAARDLVAKAMARDPGRPLYVVAIGAITNVASALLLEPAIVDRIAIIWLGGHRSGYPHTIEFNLAQDIPAARVVLDCGAPVTLIPCLGVASHMLSTPAELRDAIGGASPLCDALLEQFCAYETDHFGWAKEIWDVAAIGYLINPDWLPSALIPSPLVTDDGHWGQDTTRHPVREAYLAHRNPIFRDLFTKLRGHTA